MYKRIGTTIAIAIAAMLSPSSIAEAAGSSANHCVQRVVSQRSSGELVLGEARCYATFAQAMRAEDVTAWGEGASVRAAQAAHTQGGVGILTFTLATHYELVNLNPAGGTTSTVGGACSGGWINTVPAWTNRISSTANGCPNVVHYDGANLTGDNVTTTGGGGNLGAMNNRTNSIQYA